MTITSRPLTRASIGGLPKSTSGPTASGQLGLPARQLVTYTSFGVTCFIQRIDPVLRSSATTASLDACAGAL